MEEVTYSKRGVSSVGEEINQGRIVVDVNIVVGRCQALNLR